MQNYGIIWQDEYMVIFDQKIHKRVFRSKDFKEIYEWMNSHMGQYTFYDFNVIIDDQLVQS